MTTTLLGVKRVGDSKLSANKSGMTYSETYEYLVQSNNINETYWDVITTTGLPDVFITSQNNLTCTSKSGKRDDGCATLWHVTAEFTAETTGQDTQNDPDPANWIPIWTGTIETYDEVLMSAKYADTPFSSISGSAAPYVNSAKCKFPEPLINKKPIVVMEFAQYESYVLSVSTIAGRNEKINDTTFKGFAKWTLKVNVKSFTKGYYFNYPKTLINYTVAYKPDKWTDKPLDMGYEFFKTAGDANRVVSDKIVSLAANGTDLGGSVDPVCNRQFFPWDETSFSAFIR